MDALEVSWVDQRWRFGSVIVMPQSRFLAPIAPELYQYSDMSVVVDAREGFRAQSRRQEQKTIRTTREPEHDDFSQETVQYRVGQHVMHKLYGRGEILNLSGFGVDMRMTVLFSDGARRKMMARFADFDQHN
jgi:DNA helicase-2/ATP-dependent DNA helicase PcrA